MLTSTDFSLIDSIRAGKEIPLAEFTQGEDEITRQIIEYGGLFNFNVARMQGKAFLPPIETAPRPMTLAEKIFAAHLVRSSGATDAPSASPGAGPTGVGVAAVKPGDAGFARTDLRFSHEYVTPMAAIFFDQLVGRDAPANDPSSIVFFRDHLTFLDEVLSEQKEQFDIIFNDVDKEDYPRVLRLVSSRLRKGGLFITDNVLWSGRVAEKNPTDATTKAILEFNRALYNSEDFFTTLLPIRDGLAVALKK